VTGIVPSGTGRLVLRGAIGFACGLAIWTALSPPYERAVAATAETILRIAERPAVTRLVARKGEIVIERSDFPPAAPRPGLPADDLHFNFVILAALLALVPPFRPGRALLAGAILFGVHVVALCCQVEALYATRLGTWSEVHYGAFARNAWAAAFHAYQIAGRFAAPFAIWWPLGGYERAQEKKASSSSRQEKGKTKRRGREAGRV
jgi:hypothetical protein